MAMEKVVEYFNKTATLDAYTLVMGVVIYFLVLYHAQPNIVVCTRSRHKDESLYEALEHTSPRNGLNIHGKNCRFILIALSFLVLIFDSLKNSTLNCTA